MDIDPIPIQPDTLKAWSMAGVDATRRGYCDWPGPTDPTLETTSFQLEGPIQAVACPTPDRLYAAADHVLLAFGTDGGPLWRYDAGNYILSQPTILPDGRIQIACWKTLHTVRPDGTADSVITLDEVVQTCVFDEYGNSYVFSLEGIGFIVIARDLDGNELWRLDDLRQSVPGDLLLSGNRLYVANLDNDLTVYDTHGDLIWQQPLEKRLLGMYPMEDGYCYLHDDSGPRDDTQTVRLLCPWGDLVWSTDIDIAPEQLVGPGLLVDLRLYLVDSENALRRFSLGGAADVLDENVFRILGAGSNGEIATLSGSPESFELSLRIPAHTVSTAGRTLEPLVSSQQLFIHDDLMYTVDDRGNLTVFQIDSGIHHHWSYTAGSTSTWALLADTRSHLILNNDKANYDFDPFTQVIQRLTETEYAPAAAEPTAQTTPVYWPEHDLLLAGSDTTLIATTMEGAAAWTADVSVEIRDIATSGGRIYVRTLTDLQCLDTQGSQVYRFIPADKPVHGPSVRPGGTCYFTDRQANIYAISPDGSESWRYNDGLGATSHPIVAARNMILIPHRNRLLALSDAGKRLWEYSNGSDYRYGPPAVDNQGRILLPVVYSPPTMYPGQQEPPLSTQPSSVSHAVSAAEDAGLHVLSPGGTRVKLVDVYCDANFQPISDSQGTIYLLGGITVTALGSNYQHKWQLNWKDYFPQGVDLPRWMLLPSGQLCFCATNYTVLFGP